MNITNITDHTFMRSALITALSLALPMAASAAQTNDEIKQQLDALQSQVTALNSELGQATEWQSPNTLVHLTGYGDVGFVKPENGNSSFTVGSFSPIFHFQYRDLVMLESELEIQILPDGSTKLEMEYLTVDWFMNDYATLVAGKFLSPIGQFRQNLHPSWINKMPSAPPGFSHDGAAPVSEIGFQVRGGFLLGSMRSNYAVYASNGPELNSATADEVEFELEGIRAEGFGADRDGDKTYGGRFALLPIPSVEIGLSMASGKATVTELEVTPPSTGLESGFIEGQTARDYSVTGADFVWFTGNMSLRAEYVKTDIGEANTGATKGAGAVWEAWYSQFAYRLPNSKWEGVLRYTDFDSPGTDRDVKQSMYGVNYLISNNFIAKFAYEMNDGTAGEPSDDNRALVQLAYGF
jgi:hypothetical protein